MSDENDQHVWKEWRDQRSYLFFPPQEVVKDIIELIPTFFERHIADERWNWNQLSMNQGIPLDFIENHPHLPWIWQNIVLRNDLSMSFIERNRKKTIDSNDYWVRVNTYEQSCIDPETIPLSSRDDAFWRGVSNNTSISQEFIRQNKDEAWNWLILSSNPAVTSQFIEETKTYGFVSCKRTMFLIDDNVRSWRWSTIGCNPSLTLRFIEDNISELNMNYLSQNPVITPEFIDLHQDWNYVSLSYNPSMTFEYVINNLNKKWNWYALSKYLPNVVECYKSHPELPWSWRGLSRNTSLTLSFIEENLERFDPKRLSRNSVITPQFIEKHPDFAWNWASLSKNPNIMKRF